MLGGKIGLELLLLVNLHFVLLFLGVDFLTVVYIDCQVVVLVIHQLALYLRRRLPRWLWLGSWLRLLLGHAHGLWLLVLVAELAVALAVVVGAHVEGLSRLSGKAIV